MVEKIFQKSSEPSLQSQESNKTNGVQFRLRITKNQHKQIKPPKLSFQQTEPNETGWFGFPNRSIWLTKYFKKFQNLPYKVRNPTRQTEFNSDYEKPRTNTNKPNHPNCRSRKLNQMNRLVWFSQLVQMVDKIFQKIPEPSLQS